MISRSKAPMLTREEIVITKVLKIICKFLPPLFSNLKILKILKDLNSVIAPLISSEVRADMIMLKPDAKATKQSKVFQASLKKGVKP